MSFELPIVQEFNLTQIVMSPEYMESVKHSMRIEMGRQLMQSLEADPREFVVTVEWEERPLEETFRCVPYREQKTLHCKVTRLLAKWADARIGELVYGGAMQPEPQPNQRAVHYRLFDHKQPPELKFTSDPQIVTFIRNREDWQRTS